jgi:hypothetical protein
MLVNIAQTQKTTIFLTLASVNNFAKKMNLKKKFSNAIFFLFILYYYLPFLDKKKTLQNIFAFSSNSSQIEHIEKKNTKHKGKKKHARSPQINQRRSPNIFKIF